MQEAQEHQKKAMNFSALCSRIRELISEVLYQKFKLTKQ